MGKKSKQNSLFEANEPEQDLEDLSTGEQGTKQKGGSPNYAQLTSKIDPHEAISGLIKYLRRGEEEKALLLSFMLLERWPYWLFRRLITASSEEVGNANPMAAVLASSIFTSWLNCREHKKDWLGRVLVAQLVIYLCRSPKSREADNACLLYGQKLVNGEGEKLELDDYVYDMHVKRGRSMGRGMKHFTEIASQVVNEQGEDKYRLPMINYYKKLGKYV
jgi:replication-associated recombination protein RarA